MDCHPHCETLLKTEPLSWGIAYDRGDEAVSRGQKIETVIIFTEANPQLELGELTINRGHGEEDVEKNFGVKLNFGFKKSDTIT